MSAIVGPSGLAIGVYVATLATCLACPVLALLAGSVATLSAGLILASGVRS